MTIATTIEALLAADATLGAALTGGIYTYQETGRLGISKKSTPAAFDTNGLLKPCAVVKQRSRVPTSAIMDAGEALTSEAVVIEVWLYSDGKAAAPEAAADRVYTLLHEQFISDGRLKWINQLDDYRDPEMDHANVIKLDFEYLGIRS